MLHKLLQSQDSSNLDIDNNFYMCMCMGMSVPVFWTVYATPAWRGK